MNLKKLLFLVIIAYTNYNVNCSNNNFSTQEELKKYFEEQQKAHAEQKEQFDKIIQLLALSLQLEAEKIQNAQNEEKNKLIALKKEAEKGFSFTECGIVIRDTFLEEFDLRNFSIEFCQGVVKTFKRLVLNKAIQETFNGVDYTFGTAMTRYIHPQAGIYPINFLGSNSLSEYISKRKTFIEEEDPRVRFIHKECDRLLNEACLTQPLQDATKRLQNVGEAILKRKTLHPEEYELQIFAVKREPKSRMNKAEEVNSENDTKPSATSETK